MRTSLLLAIIWVSFASFGQVIKEIPTDENGKVNFSEVVQVDSVVSSELFIQSKQLIGKLNGYSIEKLTEDIENKLVIIKVKDHVNTGMFRMDIEYKVKIISKDYRYKIEMYDIIYLYDGGNFSLAEEMFDEKRFYKGNKQPRSFNLDNKKKTENYFTNLKSIASGIMINNKSESKTEW